MADNNIFPQAMKDLHGYFKDEQLEKLYNSILPLRDKLLVRLLMVTGRRVTEIVGRKEFTHKWRDKKTGEYKTKVYPAVEGLRPKHIDWEEQTIVFSILKKKHAEKRIKKIDTTTLSMIRKFITEENIGLNENIIQLSRQRVYQVIQIYCQNVGINMVGTKAPHPHHFRHTYAIKRIKKYNRPEELIKLQKHLEHSSINVTAHYLQFGQEDEGAVAEELFEEFEE